LFVSDDLAFIVAKFQGIC